MRRTIFDEDHDAFRESCRTFVDRTLRPHHEKHMANQEFGREVWLELGKRGFLGLNVMPLERPSTANGRHQQQPASLKLARALNPRATHRDTLVMRRSRVRFS
jgi:alkylation response protein AidB-like acyl-CoA dehydrogenase